MELGAAAADERVVALVPRSLRHGWPAAAPHRQRRIGIVAVARKLLIALWRYLETGALPEGAMLKA